MKYKVTLNGKQYEIEVERGEAVMLDVADAPLAAPVAAPAPSAAPAAAAAPTAPTAPSSGEAVFSPMPGSILQVKVSAGQTVRKGDILVVLEAMKMENEILAPRDATVTQVVVSKGSQVDTGAALIYLF